MTVPADGALSVNDWLRAIVNCASTVWRSSVLRAVAVWSWGCAVVSPPESRVIR